MKTFINHMILFIYCILIAVFNKNFSIFSVTSVIALLASVIITNMSFFFHNKKFTASASGIYVIISLFIPEFALMLPALSYDIMEFSGYPFIIFFISSIMYNYVITDIQTMLFLLFGIFISIILQNYQKIYSKAVLSAQKLRDDSTEVNLVLKSRNESLLKNQDYEIHNATLQERNRIAREIHDNVGHMLSRAILLTGVIKTINKDENCSEHLENLHEALNQAMTSIRNSVHNLHDESIDLKQSVTTIIDEFSFCPVSLNYDMGYEVPKDIKYCFIAIIKEGLNNIYKHSDATKVNVTLREHPSMYQLIIHDNGNVSDETDFNKYISPENRHNDSGIGLENIAARVNMLNGSIKIHTDDGFCIFITIPKGDKLHEYSNNR
ncbi:MAG: GHKL domain-containing protein [Lachnospiraceae bacterium]|nr:GHKL domain-containing protein [Lachnospiraceae bacterium]MBQ2319721.1 GHKL domain-containing protein [Lachnospiraceae bacterium]